MDCLGGHPGAVSQSEGVTIQQMPRRTLDCMNALLCRFAGLQFVLATRLPGDLYLAAQKAVTMACPRQQIAPALVHMKSSRSLLGSTRLRLCGLASDILTLIVDSQTNAQVRLLERQTRSQLFLEESCCKFACSKCWMFLRACMH